MSHEQIGTKTLSYRQGLDVPSRQLGGSGIVPGKGWEVIGEPAGKKCDGEC
jgi:hypothetical protein